MKVIGFLLTIIIWGSMGLMPVACLDEFNPHPPMHFGVIYLDIFFIINCVVWIYFAIKFGIWFESNIKEKEE
jgi:hypothetical protein